MKYCKDCKYCQLSVYDGSYWCSHPLSESGDVSLVTGHRYSMDPGDMRSEPASSSCRRICGSEGRWWAPSIRYRMAKWLSKLLGI